MKRPNPSGAVLPGVWAKIGARVGARARIREPKNRIENPINDESWRLIEEKSRTVFDYAVMTLAISGHEFGRDVTQ